MRPVSPWRFRTGRPCIYGCTRHVLLPQNSCVVLRRFLRCNFVVGLMRLVYNTDRVAYVGLTIC